MEKKTLQKLEFHKIVEQLTSFASSVEGKKLCSQLVPMVEQAAIEHAQEETKAAFDRIIQKGQPYFGKALPVTASLKRLEIGASLSAPELLHLCQLMETSGKIKSYGRRDLVGEHPDALDSYFQTLEPLTPLSMEIRRCIQDEETIYDDASPGLHKIRKSMATVNERIHSTLTSMVNGSLKSYLQDPIITMRENRYCIPVKAEYKGQVPGMIHDRSSSGSTLFVEPMAIVKYNNDLKELAIKETEEIEIILSTLSASAGEHITQLYNNHSVLTQLDFIFAKGALAIEQNATRPVLNTEGRIHIRQGRHPLLDKKKVVPITVSLGDDFDLLIITGPNTGGKTVSLKTVGLFTLMSQAGLHIPALDRSKIAIFRSVYADIGDEQSIEQSLSTFSSHMSNIVSFLNRVDEESLVLFDELGAGTDPTEGAALATAILSYLHDRGIRTMATTHYSELKVFALSTPGVENASCEFDVASLRPTYRLLIGIPGKSNAFAISGKLGLPEFIINSAKRYLSTQDESFESLLSDLEVTRLQLEKEQAALEQAKAEAEALRHRAKEKQSSIESQRERILEEAKEEARALLQEAKDVADETIKSFRKYQTASPNAAKMEQERERLRKQLKKNAKTSDLGKSAGKPAKPQRPQDFKPGESVKVLSMNLKGIVSTMPDAKGNLFVQMGILRSQVHISDLELIPDENPYALKNKRSGSSMKMGKSLSIRPEINLLGKTVDEAVAELDKYLDDAYLSHLTSVRIVHGKGTGALRKGIHQYLKRSPHVKSYRLGEFGEGDAGVTIVKFKN